MPDPLDVPVSGGTLRVAAWSGSGDPVLAIHGITSSSRSWPFLAEALDNSVLAPDLRGRGRSNQLPGPAGIAQHAEDCAAVVEATGSIPLVVVGHSMGGFVATVLAARRPDLVRAWCWSTAACRSRPPTRRRRSPASSRSRSACRRRTPARATATGSAATRRSPATGRPRPRSTPTTTSPTRPAAPRPTPTSSRRTSSTWSRGGVRRGARQAAATAGLPARVAGLRRRPSRALPAADRRRVRRALARPRRPARAGRQPLHDRAQPPRRGRRRPSRQRRALSQRTRIGRPVEASSHVRGRHEPEHPRGVGRPPEQTDRRHPWSCVRHRRRDRHQGPRRQRRGRLRGAMEALSCLAGNPSTTASRCPQARPGHWLSEAATSQTGGRVRRMTTLSSSTHRGNTSCVHLCSPAASSSSSATTYPR